MLSAKNIKKTFKQIKIPWLKIFFFFFGILIIVATAIYMQEIVQGWNSSIWYENISSVVVLTFLLSLGVAFLLFPFSHVETIKNIIKVALLPTAGIIKIGYIYTFIFIPYISLAILILIPLAIWFALKSLNVIPFIALIDDRAPLYVVLIAALTIFTFRGRQIAEQMLGWSQPKVDYSRLYSLLKPSLVRVYVYFLMVALYTISNLEDFSTIQVITSSWWITLKKVIVEVLLTYVALDSLLVAWQDHKDVSNNHSL